MKVLSRVVVACAALLVSAMTSRAQHAIEFSPSAQARSASSLQSQSLEFIQNRGQLADQLGKPMPEVLYTLDGQGVRFYFTKNSMHYVFTKYVPYISLDADSSFPHRPMPPGMHMPNSNDTVSLYRVDVEFAGANANVTVEPDDERSHYTNYYLSWCRDGITHVPAYGRITYRNLYPNIDLTLYVTDSGMKYDFIVHPGADPNVIRMKYRNVTALELDDDGGLRVVVPYGEVREPRPISFQTQSDSNRAVRCRFAKSGSDIGFAVGEYDPSHDLVIDPPRLWGTYFGGPIYQYDWDLGVDRHNNVDIVGWTESPSGIATTGAFQTTINSTSYYSSFAASFSPTGSLRWATYYTGNNVSYTYGVACDASCSVIAAGWTLATDVMGSAGSYQPSNHGSVDGYLVSFDSNGVRNWGTFLGGTGYDYCFSVAVDSSDHILIGGYSNSSSGIATSNAPKTTLSGTADALIGKFNTAGVPDWITYYGDHGDESINTICSDRASNIFTALSTTGYLTDTANGLATLGAYQTRPSQYLIAKFTPSGFVDWATYFFQPSTLLNGISRIAVGRAGNLYLAGTTTVSGLASLGAYQETLGGGADGFLAHFDSAGHYKWATYYGGLNSDGFNGIAVDSQESMVAAGQTNSPGLASVGEYQTSASSAASSALIVRFDSSGRRRWATYYGDSSAAFAVGIDRYNHPAVSGYTWDNSGKCATPGAYQIHRSGSLDCFIVRFCDTLGIPVRLTPNTQSVCPGTSIRLQASSGIVGSYQWYRDGTMIPGATSSGYTVPSNLPSGTYWYQVSGSPMDQNVCVAASSPIKIIVGGATIAMAEPPEICEGDAITLFDTITGYGNLSYHWTPTAGLDKPDSARPLARPLVTTVYRLEVTDSIGCTSTDSVAVIVHKRPLLTLPAPLVSCSGSPVRVAATVEDTTVVITWTPATGLDRSDSLVVYARPLKTTIYTATITDRYGCTSRDSVRVTVAPAPRLDAGKDKAICLGSSTQIGAAAAGGLGPYHYLWTPSTGLDDPTKPRPTASPSVTTLYTVLVTDNTGCTAIDSVRVSVADSLSPNVQPGSALILCIGDTATLRTESGFSTYRWSTGETGASIRVADAGDYTVSVTNAAGCTGSTTVHVETRPDSVPRPRIVASALALCGGDSVLLTTGSFARYHWSTGDTAASIYVHQGGAYQLVVENGAGCSGSDSIDIQFEARPDVSLTPMGPTIFCEGDSVTLAATPGYHYEWWYNSNRMVDTSTTIIAGSAGAYRVIAFNSVGCSDTSNAVELHVTPRPKLRITGVTSMCPGSKTQYQVEGADSAAIVWQLSPSTLGTITGQGTASITIDWENAQSAGTLTVKASKDGCDGIASLPITISSDLKPDVVADGPLQFCEGETVTLDAGTGYATYEWRLNGSPIVGRTSHDLTVSQSGSFTVFVTSAGGCSGESAPITVTVYPTPAKPIVTRTGGVLSSTASSQYQWSENGSSIPGETNQTFTPQHGGRYTVTITDANGCSNTSDPYDYDNSGSATVILPAATRAKAGEKITLPLTLTDATNVAESGASAYHATISYNGSMLAPQPLTGTETGGIRRLTVTGSLPTPLPTPPFVLQNLSFTATLGTDTCTDVTIDTFYFDDANVAVTYLGGGFCLDGVCIIDGHVRLIDPNARITLSAPHPNPVTNEVTFDYELAEDGQTSLIVQDLLGRTALVIHNEPMKQGQHSDHVTLQGLSSGSYRVVLKTPNDTRTQRMEVMR